MKYNILLSSEYDYDPEVREWLDAVQRCISEAFDCSQYLEKTMKPIEQFDHHGIRYRKLVTALRAETLYQQRAITVPRRPTTYHSISATQYELAYEQYCADNGYGVGAVEDGDIIRERTKALEAKITRLEEIQSSQSEIIRAQDRVHVDNCTEIGELRRDLGAAKKDVQALTETNQNLMSKIAFPVRFEPPAPLLVQQDSHLREQIQRIHDLITPDVLVGRLWILGQIKTLLALPVVDIMQRVHPDVEIVKSNMELEAVIADQAQKLAGLHAQGVAKYGWQNRAEALRRILKKERGGRIVTWAMVDKYVAKMDT
jgi:hypothetical protein